PAIRAGALMRLARVLRRAGRHQESVLAYKQLAAIGGVQVAGAPAELVARVALCETSREGIDSLRADLLRGRWHLTRGQFEFYWSELPRLGGRNEPAPLMPPQLEQAAELAWRERNREPISRGQATVWVDGRPSFLMWRGAIGRRAMLVTTPEV